MNSFITLQDDTLHQVHIGDDVREFLGITKYEPPIPVHMGGEVFNAFGCTVSYDIENWKKWPDVIKDGEDVVFTEKLHGTWACFGYHPDIGVPIVTSKGWSSKGLAFKFNDANKDNLYIRTFLENVDVNGDDYVTQYRRKISDGLVPFYILGEIYGKCVQDLQYGADKPTFRAFDIYVGEPGSGEFLNVEDFANTCEYLGIPVVPLLYQGPFSKEVLMEHTNGKEVVSGGATCIREGLVISVAEERRDPFLGRVILKSVSDAYLERKGGTEFN